MTHHWHHVIRVTSLIQYWHDIDTQHNNGMTDKTLTQHLYNVDNTDNIGMPLTEHRHNADSKFTQYWYNINTTSTQHRDDVETRVIQNWRYWRCWHSTKTISTQHCHNIQTTLTWHNIDSVLTYYSKVSADCTYRSEHNVLISVTEEKTVKDKI